MCRLQVGGGDGNTSGSTQTSASVTLSTDHLAWRNPRDFETEFPRLQMVAPRAR